MKQRNARNSNNQPDLVQPDEGLVGWLYKYTNKHQWRTDGLYEFEDLIQEGYLCYCHIHESLRRRFGDEYAASLEPQHFMALFKISWSNWINDLSKMTTKKRVEMNESEMRRGGDDEGESRSYFEEVLAVVEPGDLTSVMQVIAEAPTAVKEVLQMFVDESATLLRGPYKVDAKGYRESTNEFLCRLTGYDSNKIDLVKKIKDYLKDRVPDRKIWTDKNRKELIKFARDSLK